MYVLLYHPQNGPMDGGVVYLDGALQIKKKPLNWVQYLNKLTVHSSYKQILYSQAVFLACI